MLRPTIRTLLAISFLVSCCCADNRSFNGSGNNLANPTWGQKQSNFIRIDPTSHYDDGISSPAILNRPNPRDVSNTLGSQATSMLDARGLSDFTWQWGQFIDHDMTRTRITTIPMFIDVTTPTDPLFPFIPMFRTDFDFSTGTSISNPRQHYNESSGYIDASMIYGSSQPRADGLRDFAGGRLKMDAGGLLPRNIDRFENENPGDEPHPSMFLAGDTRTNEQHGLISMHTLFVREHNRLAAQVAADNPNFTDEQIYQRTRKIVGGLVQRITYDEYLPALTGTDSMLPGARYDPNTNAMIANEFAAAIFRLGHTQVSPTLARVDNNGNMAPGGPRTLDDAFFTPSMIDNQEIDYVLKGLASQIQQSTDLMIVDELRNQLFGIVDVPSGGLDLLSININRGRDHGLPTLPEIQAAVGLPVATSFADVTSDPSLQADLASVYASVDDLDLWVGLLAEDTLPGSALGSTMQSLVLDQFEKSMVGDRFFYLWDEDLTDAEVDYIDSTRLSDIILANTGITNLQGNVFFVPEPTAALLLLCGLTILAGRRSRR